MKILRRKIIHDIDRSFSIVTFSHLQYPLHYHDEYELILMTSGTGREYIGHAVGKFAQWDLTLIGKGVPHVHICDSMSDPSVKTESSCEVLYFPASLFPENMEVVEEYRPIHTLLKKSMSGIRFTDPDENRRIHADMKKIRKTTGIARVQVLLSILDKLSCSSRTRLVSPLPVSIEKENFADAVTRIQVYLKEAFRENLSLNDIAGKTGMNANAMCRLFKRETGQTVFHYLARHPHRQCLPSFDRHRMASLPSRMGIRLCQPVPLQSPVQTDDRADPVGIQTIPDTQNSLRKPVSEGEIVGERKHFPVETNDFQAELC